MKEKMNEIREGLTEIQYGGIFSEIEGYRIYDKGKVLYSSNRSYLEKNSISDDGKTESFRNYRIESFIIENPKRANKLNLNRKDNFFINENLKYSINNKSKVLYVHVSNITVEKIGEVIGVKTKDETNFINAYKLNFKYGYKYSDYAGKNTTKENECIVTDDHYSRTEESDFRIRCKEIAENLKEKENLDLSYYDIQRIFNHYNITDHVKSTQVDQM